MSEKVETLLRQRGVPEEIIEKFWKEKVTFSLFTFRSDNKHVEFIKQTLARSPIIPKSDSGRHRLVSTVARLANRIFHRSMSVVSKFCLCPGCLQSLLPTVWNHQMTGSSARYWKKYYSVRSVTDSQEHIVFNEDQYVGCIVTINNPTYSMHLIIL